MTSQKDFKRLVRARMQKTGEAYTAARAQLLAKPTRSRAKKSASASTSTIDYGKLAGMSDAVVKEKTGCTWDRWVHALDRAGADTLTHREIVDLVHKRYETPDWWSQMVTVGYERIKGLRARGQRRDGTYEATKSRTFAVPIATLHDAFASSTKRAKWLDESGVKVRTSTPPKSIRLGFVDGSIVAVGFTPKGSGKSMVALSHAKLPSKDAAEQVTKYWSDRFTALAGVLAKT